MKIFKIFQWKVEQIFMKNVENRKVENKRCYGRKNFQSHQYNYEILPDFNTNVCLPQATESSFNGKDSSGMLADFRFEIASTPEQIAHENFAGIIGGHFYFFYCLDILAKAHHDAVDHDAIQGAYVKSLR